ncbi:MAG: DUF3015 family protein [Campylobacterota bacterium]|nr:DUF3015 family protein [Campylobacterota bacterium]
MKKFLVSMAAVAALSTAGMAAANDQTGCGLGSQVFKTTPDSALLLSVQAILNGISGNQTFGITSGTSGCKKARLVMNERAEEFVASNMDQLAKEIAMGHGESVDTLAELLNVEDKEGFALALQANYRGIYTSENAEMADVLDNIASM